MAEKMPFGGPFLGLNTTQSARELPPGFATVARNVVYAEGDVRPRAPFAGYLYKPDGAWMTGRPAQEIISLFHSVGRFSHIGRMLLIKVRVRGRDPYGQIWMILERQGLVSHEQLVTKTTDLPADFAIFNNKVYICDGGDHVYRIDQFGKLFYAGIPKPAAVEAVIGSGNLNHEGLDPHRYQYAVTWYNQTEDIESNATFTPTLDGTAFDDRGALVRISLVISGTPPVVPAKRGITHWRVYRRDFTAEQVPYVLVRTIPINVLTFLDYKSYLGTPAPAPEGTTEAGPYAPAKNTPPDNRDFTCLAPYKDRMFYGRATGTHSDKLFYSSFSRPDYVDDDDYELFHSDDAGDGITGLAELSGQLVIGKRRSIHILSGTIETTTNDTIATGAAPPESTHSIHRAAAVSGCANTGGGNGLVVAGKPPLVYYNGEAGFYRFDGINEVMVSAHIKPTWREFARGRGGDEARQAVNYAIDPANEIIYMANAENSLQGRFGDRPPEASDQGLVLAYHYGRRLPDGLGLWSEIDTDVAGENQGILAVATAMGSAAADPSGRQTLSPERYVQLLVATASGHIYESDDRESSELPMPHFEHRTGRLRMDEGYLLHAYYLKWLHDQGAAGSLIRVGLWVEGDPDKAEESVIDVGASIYSRQPLRRVGTDVVLFIRNSDPPATWKRNISVVGWVLIGDRAGERK